MGKKQLSSVFQNRIRAKQMPKQVFHLNLPSEREAPILKVTIWTQHSPLLKGGQGQTEQLNQIFVLFRVETGCNTQLLSKCELIIFFVLGKKKKKRIRVPLE